MFCPFITFQLTDSISIHQRETNLYWLPVQFIDFAAIGHAVLVSDCVFLSTAALHLPGSYKSKSKIVSFDEQN